MLTRETGYLTLRRPGSGSAAAKHLQAEEYVVLEQVFDAQAVDTLAGDPGRMFIQCHYGRRDVAQRLRPTAEVKRLSEEARARAKTQRQRTLVGLHRNGFYDG